jgi:hypothetical protein
MNIRKPRMLRCVWGGLIILSTLLCVGAGYLWIVSAIAIEVVHWARGEGSQYVVRTFYVAERRIAYRWQSAPPGIASVPPGVYHFQAEGGRGEQDDPPYDGFMGFELVDTHLMDPATNEPSIHVVRMSMPVWLPFILFGIAPAYWLTHHQRLAVGHCQTCGYDLRETPDVCPECGTKAHAPE